jgi:flagellar assembly protein FliH
MGKVVQGTHMSEQRYRIDVPEPRRDGQGEPRDSLTSALSYDIEEVIRASHRIVDDSASDARTLVNDARERAKAIVAKALEMAGELENKGYSDGLERAQIEQDAALREVVQEARASLGGIVDKVQSERRQFFLDAERDLIELAFEIAKKIIQHEIETSSDVALDVTRAALKRLSEREQVTIRVSPHDLDGIRAHRDEFLHDGDIGDLRIIADPRVDHGGVIIETDGGSIDGRIEAQLQVAQEALLGVVDAEPDSLR